MTDFFWNSRYWITGLRLARNGSSLSSTGRRPSRKSRSAGRPLTEASSSGPRSTNRLRRCGDSSRTERSVGERSRATGISWLISGCALAWNWSSRSSVARDSRWKVGRIWNVCASAWSSEASASNVLSVPRTTPASCWSRSVSAWKTVPVSRTTPFSAAFWRSRTSMMSEASVTNGPRLPNASLRSRPRPSIAVAAFACQRWKEVRVSSSRALKISSICVASSVRLTPSVPPSGSGLDVVRLGVGDVGRGAQRDRRRLLARLRARGELDVRLAEQRLLPQDRPRVLRDRRELRLDLDLGLGRVLAVDPLVRRRELDRLHLADRDPADAHVRLERELRRLREVGGDPVALRLQRDRAAEGDPEEEDQAEAGEREADRDQDASD